MKKEDLKRLVDKIQSMTAKEIVLTMIDSLRNPVTIIDMSTFGLKDVNGVFGERNICYGCAATNTICKIGGFDPSCVLNAKEGRSYASIYGFENDEIFRRKEVIRRFELAIDGLRLGFLSTYNKNAIEGNFAIIHHDSKLSLPSLGDDFEEFQLKQFEDFANTL